MRVRMVGERSMKELFQTAEIGTIIANVRERKFERLRYFLI